MTAPETRIVNQCTYTPIVNDPNIGDDLPGFKPKQPFVKQNLLAIVFNDPQYSSFLFENLTNGNEKIQTAVEEMWKGNTAGLGTILNEIEVDEIADFARTVLQVEHDLIQNARQDLEESASSVVEDERTKSVEGEVESVLDQSEANIIPLFQDKEVAVQSVQKAFADAKREIISVVEKQGASEQVVDQVKTKIASITTKILQIMTQQKISANKVTVFKSEINNLQKSVGSLVGHVDTLNAKLASTLSKNHPQTSNLMTALGISFNSNGFKRLTSDHSTSVTTGYQQGAVAEIVDWYGDQEIMVNVSVEASKQFLDYQEEINQKKLKALEAALETMKVEPVGCLQLEHLQFTPIGYEQGELVYSLPLTPGETVRLSHREWSRTETEYTQLVATSLETASEDLLSEKSELTQSSKTEEQHSSALNASVSASGSYGPVQISTSVGYSAQNSASRSAEYSAKHAQEITKKASSRSIQEHKISFRVTTQFEVEDESYREVTNKSDRAVRWDFHRLMKKWQIDLYRYGIRLTYDLVIPEPGSYLLRKYIQLKALNDLLAQPNPFNLSPENIYPNSDELKKQMQQYGVSVESPPPAFVYITTTDEQTYPGKGRQRTTHHLELELPEGYEFFSCQAYGSSVAVQSDDWTTLGGSTAASVDVKESDNRNVLSNWFGNKYFWEYACLWGYRQPELPESGTTLSISVWVEGKRSKRLLQEWQMRAYQQLADAARVQYANNQLRWKKLRDELLAELNREDALMLRKLEKEEIMKDVLRWVLGPAFSFYPVGLPDPSDRSSEQEYYNDFYEQGTAWVQDFRKWADGWVSGGVRQKFYSQFLQFGEIIRFLHQAIEWENVNYVLYPYFWTDDTRWDFKQFLYHTDYVHRSFLRAGAARVVLTIRPGFEKAFLSFMETGKLGELLSPGHSYMTLAEELKEMAKTTYPYTPNANEEKEENRVDRWYEFTPTGALDVTEGTVIEKDNQS